MTARRIQDVALKYFAQKGYEGTTLGEIAEEVGIKKPSIYAHFPSKSALFLAVVEEVSMGYQFYWEKMILQTTNLDIEQRLYYIFDSVIHFFASDRTMMNFWARVWMFPPKECDKNMLAKLREMNDGFVKAISLIFVDALQKNMVRSASAEHLAYLFFCMLDGTLMRTICYSDRDIQKNMPSIWASFWLGIKINPK